jgi:hypothetical protein
MVDHSKRCGGSTFESFLTKMSSDISASKSWSGLCVTLRLNLAPFWNPECTRVVDLIGLLDLHH